MNFRLRLRLFIEYCRKCKKAKGLTIAFAGTFLMSCVAQDLREKSFRVNSSGIGFDCYNIIY